MFHTLVLEYGSTSSKFPFAARSPQAPPYKISCSKFIIQTGIEDNQMRVTAYLIRFRPWFWLSHCSHGHACQRSSSTCKFTMTVDNGMGGLLFCNRWSIVFVSADDSFWAHYTHTGRSGTWHRDAVKFCQVGRRSWRFRFIHTQLNLHSTKRRALEQQY